MYNTIVVGTDGSATANTAVEHAARLATCTGAELHVGMATPSIPILVTPEMMMVDSEWTNATNQATTSALDAAAALAEAAGATVTTHRLSGDPADALMSLCDDLDADLLVIGNRGMQGARRFLLGSVSSRCAHHCNRSILIVNTA